MGPASSSVCVPTKTGITWESERKADACGGGGQSSVKEKGEVHILLSDDPVENPIFLYFQKTNSHERSQSNGMRQRGHGGMWQITQWLADYPDLSRRRGDSRGLLLLWLILLLTYFEEIAQIMTSYKPRPQLDPKQSHFYWAILDFCKVEAGRKPGNGY